MISLSQPLKCYVVLILSCILLWSCNQKPKPQEPDPVRRKSPIAIAKTLHPSTGTYIKIVYGQPYKRGREIFGNIVPYDQVWRTGANEATELTTTQDITFAGKKLEAGTYALFTIPHENGNWTIILNDTLGQWGAFDYNQASDVMRVEVQAMMQQKSTEAFTIRFSDIEENSTSIIMQWDKTLVKIPIGFLQTNTASS